MSVAHEYVLFETMTRHDGISDESFKAIMRNVAASVVVITTAHNGHLHGMTATAFCSVSANPATILVVINRTARSHPLIAASKVFAVNILSDSQKHLGERFAGRLDDQFNGVEHRLGSIKCPILGGAAAFLECQTIAENETDTHTIFVGRVVGGGDTNEQPLLYHRGAYRLIAL